MLFYRIFQYFMIFSRKFRSESECDKRRSECGKHQSECDKRGSECGKRQSEYDKRGSEKREKNSRKRIDSQKK